MLLFPAIDLYENKVVRLLKGDYNRMTVYSDAPVRVAQDFAASGITHIHLVDLEGARSGETPNLETVLRIKEITGLFCEIGGGVRSMEVVRRYLDAGIDRVILGTAAVTDEAFLQRAVGEYPGHIAVSVDIRDGCVAIRGWEENTKLYAFDFIDKLCKIGIDTVICTDISRDGAMHGTNRQLYKDLTRQFKINITASGGVSTLEDIRALHSLGLYGSIIGKAYYTGAVDLKAALEAIQ